MELFFQPAFNLISAVLGFPIFQRLMIAAFGFNHFASVRIPVCLQRSWFASNWRGGGSGTTLGVLRV